MTQLRSLIVRMGGEVSDMLVRSLRALCEGDARLAQAVIAADRRVNRLEIDVDELAMRIIARRQPVASDLRFVTTTLKLDTDLERVGDLCVDVCERALELGRPTNAEAGLSLQAMGEKVRGMLETALAAFLNADVGLAERVIDADEAVDQANRRLFELLLAGMRAGRRSSEDGVRLLAVGRYLERIADHATNLAEMAIFYAQGRDVRHPDHPGGETPHAPAAPPARRATLAAATPERAVVAPLPASRNRRPRLAAK